MMCPYREDEGPSEMTTLMLTNFYGRNITLERTKCGTEKGELGRKQTVWNTDWSSVLGCNRCDGHALPDGGMKGGTLTVYRINPEGTWVGFLAACHCYFGAWWTRETTDPDGRVRNRPIPFADRLKDLPSGLGNLDWRWLHLTREPGDSYIQAAYRLPEEEDAVNPLLEGLGIKNPAASATMAKSREQTKVRIVQAIERWQAGNPPKWDPEAGDNRKPEQGQMAEETQ